MSELFTEPSRHYREGHRSHGQQTTLLLSFIKADDNWRKAKGNIFKLKGRALSWAKVVCNVAIINVNLYIFFLSKRLCLNLVGGCFLLLLWWVGN